MNTTGYKIVINGGEPNNPNDPNDTTDTEDTEDTEEPGVSIETVSGERITIYPNPAKDIISLLNINQIQTIELFSVTGELIEKIVLDGSTQTNLSIHNYAIGTYLIHFVSENKRQVMRLIKQ